MPYKDKSKRNYKRENSNPNNKDARKRYKSSEKGKLANKRYRLKKLCNITLEDWEQQYKVQRGCCALCGRAFLDMKVQTDHNHKTGKFRGLLCVSCNTLIGWYENNKDKICNYTG